MINGTGFAPDGCVASVVDIAVTDLLNPAKARKTPIEQRTKPIKTRGLKKADRAVEFVFIEVIISLVCLVFK